MSILIEFLKDFFFHRTLPQKLMIALFLASNRGWRTVADFHCISSDTNTPLLYYILSVSWPCFICRTGRARDNVWCQKKLLHHRRQRNQCCLYHRSWTWTCVSWPALLSLRKHFFFHCLLWLSNRELLWGWIERMSLCKTLKH